MKINKLLIPSLLALTLSAPVLAKGTSSTELASPIVSLMPALVEIRNELNLDDKQDKSIDAWLASAPAKKKEHQQQVLAIRAELRKAIINRDSRVKRDELKTQLNEANTRLIELSSICTRHLHSTLSNEQYAQVVAQYKKSN